MYEVGDTIRMTDDLIFPFNPFIMLKVEKGKEMVVIDVNRHDGYYKVRGLQDSPFVGLNTEEIIRKVPLRIEKVSEKLDPKAKPSTATSTGKNQYTTIVSHGLSFANAMLHLEAGYKVTRQIWGGYWNKQNIYTDGDLGARYKEAIVAHLKDGGWAVATPYQEDMLANDWMVVK